MIPFRKARPVRAQGKLLLFGLVITAIVLSSCAKDTSPIIVKRNSSETEEVVDNQESRFSSEFKNSKLIEKYSVSVLETVRIRVDSNSDFIDSWKEILPGSVISSDGRFLNWIPKNGEEGVYEVQNDQVIKSLIVSPIDFSESVGPPQGYVDGDVGFIFIHGRGDLDLCKDDDELDFYWLNTPRILAPNLNNRNVVCYDGRDSVEELAPQVAQQILEARCGFYDRCITVTHSMGDMILEHILIHADKEYSEQSAFAKHQVLYKQVKDRILYNIAIGSAANGSKVANILENPKDHAFGQRVVGRIADVFGADNDSSEDLQIKRATGVLAPHSRDVGIPFYMVAGYSEKRVNSTGDLSLLAIGLGASKEVFNEDTQYALLDGVASFHSRSDGAVGFRSSCGIASKHENDGPGTNASKSDQWSYCFHAPKKKNHFAWFVTNLNHSLVKVDHRGCDSNSNPCRYRFYHERKMAGEVDAQFDEMSPPRVIRKILMSRVKDYLLLD